jgi:hypothetical protein
MLQSQLGEQMGDLGVVLNLHDVATAGVSPVVYCGLGHREGRSRAATMAVFPHPWCPIP